MTSRERVIRTLNFQPVDRTPRDLWALPGVNLYRKQELEHVKKLYPSDFSGPDIKWGESSRKKGIKGEIGFWTDDWGCVRETRTAGVGGEIVLPPLKCWDSFDNYQPPWEVINNSDFSNANKSCVNAEKFMMIGSGVTVFHRMQFLRGSENLYMDLAYGTKEIYKLREMIHEYNLKTIELCANTDADAVQFLDDWGTQTSMIISPEMWREIFKPLYRDYCDILKNKGKFIFYHSDGFIEPIYPDLIELGINAINSQLFCMNIEELGMKYAGKIVFWGEIDRQHVLPFGTPNEVAAAIRRVAAALRFNGSGVIAQCEWGVNDPVENIIAVFEEWDKIQ